MCEKFAAHLLFELFHLLQKQALKASKWILKLKPTNEL
jgi:hypothetical protein